MKFTDIVTRAGAAIAAQTPDALMVAGAGAVSYGVYLVSVPAGYVIAGVFMLAGGWLLAKGSR